MEKFISSLVDNYTMREIQREYKILLSLGLSDADAAQETFSFFCSDTDERERMLFMIPFALIQWNMGRLTEDACNETIRCICDPLTNIPAEIAEELIKKLHSPMPERKKIAKTRTIKCPWKEGTLLAYKISSCEKKKDSRLWNQYVILRIVQIQKWPVSLVMPDCLYDESMYVALYDWVGETLPSAEIVQKLKYVPISIRKPLAAHFGDKTLWDQCVNLIGESRLNIDVNAQYINYIYGLDFTGRKENPSVFTRMDDMADTEENAEFINQEKAKIKIPPLVGPGGFDIILTQALEQRFSKLDNK